MANGNMGAPGKSAAPVDLVKPVADVAQKAAKAGKIKKIKAASGNTKISVKFAGKDDS